ncbi:MAG TPA: hypothetical protein VN256_20095 [Pyrinomonadaceae bacterium]|nr:hypothetical protein [Pyrinomonadaceae bacterium]
MTIELKPLVAGTTNGSNNHSEPQAGQANYSINEAIPQNFSEAISIIAKNWPSSPNDIKATTALASVLFKLGWKETEVKPLIEKISKAAGMNLKRASQGMSYAFSRLQNNEPVFGWKKLTSLLGEETIDALKNALGFKTKENEQQTNKLEILDTPPITLRKPISLIEERGYVATWLDVKLTLSETTDEDGKIIKHDPPLIKTEKRLMIMRDDGMLFNSEKNPLNNLGFEISLTEIPPVEKLWSAKGVKCYQAGERIDPKVLFDRIRTTIDRFIAFDRSLADQRSMCEFIACYILATWFLSAFNVIGFLWPNGERGSGKTQLLTLISQLSYLGQLLLAGGSYASLRDLADYGATICFDDAENLESRKFDSDKRTLLLAGNRRGSHVTVKESVGNNKWRNRYVNTYCARAFSAIALPDSVLASRTIIVPLIRTTDKTKANNDPQDFKLWPHDYRKLVDDLWALALANLRELSSYETKVNNSSSLKGRALEPWKAILAIALWLEDRGIKGLWERMNELSFSYQRERQDFESEDITSLIIRSLCRCLGCEVVSLCEVSDVDLDTSKVFVTTAKIETEALKLIEELDLDIDENEVASRKIGKKLAQLRFQKHREGGTGKYGWYASQKELAYWVKALGITSIEDE